MPPSAEVRAVFVVNIPEGALAEHPQCIRGLEHNQGMVAFLDRFANRANERLHLGNVLECMPTQDDIRAQCLVTGTVEIDDVPDAGLLPPAVIRTIARIDPDTMRATDGAELGEKFAFAAANFQHLLSRKVTFFGDLRRQFAGKVRKCIREMLRLLEIRRVLHDALVEKMVEDKAAGLAEGKLEVPPREGTRLRGAVEQHTTVHRHRCRTVDDASADLPATRAGSSRARPCPRTRLDFTECGGATHYTISSCGIGTMNCPPAAR